MQMRRKRKRVKKIGSNLIFAAAILEKKTGEREALAAQAASRSESASCDSSGVTVGPRGGSAARSAFQTSENPQQSGFFSTVEENESPFIPILSADVSAVASSGEVFRSLGSKTDPVLHVRFPRPWSVVAENRKISKWRRGWDLNPRSRSSQLSRFRVACLKPLSHPSENANKVNLDYPACNGNSNAGKTAPLDVSC